MTSRTRELVAALAREFPDTWEPIRARCEAQDAEARAHVADLSGFTASERAWFRRPLSSEVVP